MQVALNDIDTGPGQQRRIALVAHDGRKQDMREWAEFNRDVLGRHQLFFATAGLIRRRGPASCRRGLTGDAGPSGREVAGSRVSRALETWMIAAACPMTR